jgi:1-acyl-sn-glycerol-3-phosphate acyltransferase
MKYANQFQLLREKRFGPYFLTQFLGAFNDNVYKIAVMSLIAFTLANQDPAQADLLVNLCSTLFILPFFLFSATAGELADYYEKAKLVRYIKLSELIIMSLVGLAFYFESLYFLIAILFLTGTQSAFFGPIKYSILPQYLKENELVGGNGLVEMGTFIAILLGSIAGGILINLDNHPYIAVSSLTFIIALIGYATSRMIPTKKKVSLPKNQPNFNAITQTLLAFKIVRKKKSLYYAILGISWFWFYGTAFLTQLPNFNYRYLGGEEHGMTLCLTAFSLGIAIGSLLCERLSSRKIEIGLVPLGALGLTLFAIDLSFISGPIQLHYPNFQGFILLFPWRLTIDLFLMGTFGGFYIVPLYVLLQAESKPQQRSRVIAANNILNALFMAIAAGSAILLFQLGMTIAQYFLVVALINMAVTLYIFKLAPEFMMRFLVWLLIRCCYRLKTKSLKNIPTQGAAVITCNHLSYVDPLVIMAAVKRPVRFVMDYNIYHTPILHFIFKTSKCIPIAGGNESPQIKEQAFREIAKALKKGELIGIFPEGGLTRTGQLQPFQRGISRIIQRTPVTVVPLALSGLWGTYFSHRHGKALKHLPRLLPWRKIRLKAGAPIQPEAFNRKDLAQMTQDILDNIVEQEKT